MNRMISMAIALLAIPLTGCGQPLAQMVFAVRDDEGVAVTNARVGMATFKRWIPGPDFGQEEHSRVEGLTDTNGLVTLTIASERGDLAVHVKQMPGFYYDQGFDLQMRKVVGGRWQPWGQTNVLLVRRIVNPIPMYTRVFAGNVPENGKRVGFDLMEGDWVAPHGKGKVGDFLFRAEWQSLGRDHRRVLRFDARIDLSFSNAGDGICEVRIPVHSLPQGSKYRMPRFAPDTDYLAGMSWRKYETDNGHSPFEPADLNYFFRVRTNRDSDGRIVSALYGKIHGPIEFWVNDQGANFKMQYYLNPTPNDRNTEFAVGKNLMKPSPSISIGDP